ncbi:VOC family protein [Streptomyces sp. NBC_00258]|uniref:VOC family protein n=1 Tax=Streptomyces sp. NBC_00258 TaxID=2903642 RepID=UPI002E2AB7AD|nr:VOC family protein [Streptomyces sp. NBC_00258]
MAQTVTANHVGVSVKDIGLMKNWYATAFGFEEAFAFKLPDGRGIMLRSESGGAQIELFEVEGSTSGPVQGTEPPGAPQRHGYFHVALEFDDLDAAYAAAVEAGGQGVWDPRDFGVPGRRGSFVFDPEGNLVELVGV